MCMDILENMWNVMRGVMMPYSIYNGLDNGIMSIGRRGIVWNADDIT